MEVSFMANQQHLDILRQGVEVWNQWRREYKNVEPDLSGANLTSVDLSDAILGKADLRGTNLSRAYLYRAVLSTAYLNEAWS